MTGQNWWHPWCTNLRHCASVRILAYEANYTWFWCRTCSATYEHLLSVADWAWEPTFTTWDLGTYRCIPMLVILYTQPSHNCPFSPRDSRVDSLGPCRCINTRRTPMMWRSSTRRPRHCQHRRHPRHQHRLPAVKRDSMRRCSRRSSATRPQHWMLGISWHGPRGRLISRSP